MTQHSALSTQHFIRLIPHTSLLITIFLAAACQPASTETPVLPTLAVLPSLTPTETATSTPTETETPGPTNTPTITLTHTPFPTFTATSRPSETPRETVEPTQAAVATSTAAILEAPVFSTLTPGGNLPAGSTPQVIADLIITEGQFQEEVNAQMGAYPSIQRSRADFVPGGINVELTALGGEALITGNVFLSIEMTGLGAAQITIGDITVNAPEPPEAYMETVNGDFFTLMVSVLDAILTQRLGEEHNLENIIVTDTAMEVSLLVPQE